MVGLKERPQVVYGPGSSFKWAQDNKGGGGMSIGGSRSLGGQKADGKSVFGWGAKTRWDGIGQSPKSQPEEIGSLSCVSHEVSF